MPKYSVEFTIEADSLGHATNRALVALYKGDLDAEDVKVSPKDAVATRGKIPDEGRVNLANGGYIRSSHLPPPANGHTYTKEETGKIGKEALKKFIQKNRNIPKEPGKDALD